MTTHKFSLHQIVEEGNFEDVFDYLQIVKDRSDFDINNLDEDGYSPLHIAANHGFDNIVELLLQSGADPWKYTNDGANDRQVKN